MTQAAELYACLYAREFPVQALLRLRPELREQPCVVMEGDAPLEQVCSLNTKARLLGMVRGMTRVEVDTFPASAVLTRSLKEEAATRAILLECAGAFSPRLEERSADTAFVCGIDIAGTRSLFGPPEVLARRLVERVRAVGMRACVTVSGNLHAAVCMARGLPPRATVKIIPQGEEAAALAELPCAVLDPSLEQAGTFAAWGVHTLGMLAELPEKDLVARMGQEGRRLWQLARGERTHLFQPVAPPLVLAEQMELDSPVELLDSLLFVAGAMLDQLIVRANARPLRLPQSPSHSLSTVSARTLARCGRRCQPTTSGSGSSCSIWIWKRIRRRRPCSEWLSMRSRERRAKCSWGCSRRNCLRPRGWTLRWRASGPWWARRMWAARCSWTRTRPKRSD